MFNNFRLWIWDGIEYRTININVSVAMTYSKNEIIKDKVTFGNTSLKPDSALCVAFGVDSIFIKASVVSMLSFIENNDGVFFDFNIITSSIDSKDINFINELTFDNYAITIHIINEHFFDGYQEKENLPISMYYRLLIPYILHIHTDRVLYVDADTLCLGSIVNLFTIDMKGNIIAAVKDSGSASNDAKKENICSTGYFNSGVMLINTKSWVSEDVLKIFNEKIFSRDYKYPDQDVLNIILSDRVYYLNDCYNTFFSDGKLDLTNVVIVHFVGSPKPWHSWCENNKLYLSYYNKSPWGNHGLELPHNYKQCKYYSVKLKKQKKYISSTYWFFIYLLKKIMKN